MKPPFFLAGQFVKGVCVSLLLSWYAGPISEKKAEQVLSKMKEPGSFLVRDSLLPDADFVLSVK